MVKIEVESTVCNDSEGKEYTYSYFLTKSQFLGEFGKIDIYGIEVTSTNENYYTDDFILDFTTSKEYALKTIKNLAVNKVSPIHFIDVLCDEMDKGIEYINSKCL